jgi:hypothetical protein
MYKEFTGLYRNHRIIPDIETAIEVSINHLDDSFFRVRFDRLTPREKHYVRAMASLTGSGPYRSGDVAEALGLPVRSAGPVRNNLIAKGMIYAPAYGIRRLQCRCLINSCTGSCRSSGMGRMIG